MKLIKEPDKNQWNNIVFHYRRSNKAFMVSYIRTLSCCYWACWQQQTQAPLPCRPVSHVQGCCQCGTNEAELPPLLEQHTGWVQLSITQGKWPLSPGTADTLPYTGREYTPCHALSRKTQWSEPHSSHPGKFWWCHCGQCRPGKDPWHSVNSTHSLEGH